MLALLLRKRAHGVAEDRLPQSLTSLSMLVWQNGPEHSGRCSDTGITLQARLETRLPRRQWWPQTSGKVGGVRSAPSGTYAINPSGSSYWIRISDYILPLVTRWDRRQLRSKEALQWRSGDWLSARVYLRPGMAHSTAALGFRSFVMHATYSSAWPGRQSHACLIGEELSGVTWEMVDHHDRNSSCYQNRFLGLGLEHSILEVLVESNDAVPDHP
jgi:hypothetical protein